MSPLRLPGKNLTLADPIQKFGLARAEVVIHELGHALGSRVAGQKVAKVVCDIEDVFSRSGLVESAGKQSSYQKLTGKNAMVHDFLGSFQSDLSGAAAQKPFLERYQIFDKDSFHDFISHDLEKLKDDIRTLQSYRELYVHKASQSFTEIRKIKASIKDAQFLDLPEPQLVTLLKQEAWKAAQKLVALVSLEKWETMAKDFMLHHKSGLNSNKAVDQFFKTHEIYPDQLTKPLDNFMASVKSIKPEKD